MIGKRIELDGSFDERDGQQFVSGRGVHSDAYSRIHRVEPHGFMSNPIKGSKGLLISPNGNPDEAYVLGGEHPGRRPAGMPGGSTALYDASGNIIKLIGEEAVFDFASRTATFTAGNWTINCPIVTINGDLAVNGNIHATGSIIDEGGNTNNHSH